MPFMDEAFDKVERAEHHVYGPAPLAGRNKVHPAVGCTHTSAWHKEGKPCLICGTPRFSAEEIDAVLQSLEIFP